MVRKNRLISYLMNCCVCLLLIGCCDKSTDYTFYLGTYTSNGSKGIYKGVMSPEGKFKPFELKAEMENPSFLAWANEQKHIVAVSELDKDGTGFVHSFVLGGDTLLFKGKSESMGAHPCHVAVSKSGDVLVSNYSTGNTSLFNIDEQGNLSSAQSVHQHRSEDSLAVPRAHSAWFVPNDDRLVISADLGLDELQIYKIADQKLVPASVLKMEKGAGPRHLVFHPTKEVCYVVNELNSTITVVRYGQQEKVLGSFSTLPEDFAGKSYCADIRLSTDGLHLYASNRGHNSIAIFKILEDGEKLEYIDCVSVHGDWPRNFALTPDDQYLLVANQRSDNLVVFKREDDGGLTFLSQVTVPSPVCILFEK